MSAQQSSSSTLKTTKVFVCKQHSNDFMYTGTIELRCDNVKSLLVAAEVLKMGTLKVACCDFIAESIDVTNCLDIAFPSNQHQPAEITEKAFEFALLHFEEVRKNGEFPLLTEKQLSELISSDDLCVDSEETVFHSVVAWVENDKGSREKCMIDLLSHVRFSFLEPDFIIDNRFSVSKTYECLELLFKWVESHLSRAKLSERHSKRRKAYATKRETLGFVSGERTNNLKLHTLDPESNMWSCEDLPPPPKKRTSRTSYTATVIDKKLIIAGGILRGSEANIIECVDLQTKEWSTLPPMRQARVGPGLAELNGDLYVVGGSIKSTWSNSVERYDFRTRKWKKLCPMHSAPEVYLNVTVVGELLYVVGDGSSPIECYNSDNDKWTQLSHKNERLTHFGIAGVGGHLYAVGGRNNDVQESKTIERYHPSTDTWTLISLGSDLGLYDLTCASWNNRIIACVGFCIENEIFDLVEEYNLDTSEWKTLTPFLPVGFFFKTSNLFTFRK